MKTFSFITSKGFRIDVKASNPKAGYNKLNKKLIQHLTTSNIASTFVADISPSHLNYYEYDKDGFVDVNKKESK